MVKRRNMKNKKRKMIGGEGGKGDYSSWKNVRDLYAPVHKEIPSEKERLSESPHVKNVSAPQRKSPRSRRPGKTHTLKKKKWTDVKPEELRLGAYPDLVEDNRDRDPVDTPLEVIINEESNRESDGDDNPNWTKVDPYKLRLGNMYHGGAKRKYKSSKKKQKRKHSKQKKTSKRKTQKRKSSNKRRYTKKR